MIEFLIGLCFGGCALASLFMIFSFWRLARLEQQASTVPLRKNVGFMIALCLVVAAIGLLGISTIRTLDGLHGRALGGSQPLGLLISLTLLWLAFTGFQWAATLTRAKWAWRLYLLLLALWIGLFTFPFLFD